MKKIHQIIDKILVFIELNVPGIMIICVFVGFIAAVGCRYLLNLPLAKVEEAYLICFCWMALFSAPLATRDEEHVCFTILYDAVSAKCKAVIDVVGKLLLLALLIILVKPSLDTVIFYGITHTSMLKVSYTVLYAPFMFYLIATIYHYIVLIVQDVKTMVRVFKGLPAKGVSVDQEKEA